MKGWITVGKNSFIYQARIVQGLKVGKELPTILDIARTIFSSNNSEIKKEEIDDSISKIIGLSIDESISGAVSQALKKLKEENIVQNTRHGYWKKI